jgi:hypothetical protein
LIGWLVSTRLDVGSLGVCLASSIVLPAVVFVAVRRVDPDVLVGYAAFWVTIQGSYLLTNLLIDRLRRAGADGSDGDGVPERA